VTYDALADLFTVPLGFGGMVIIANLLPRALVPDKDWPYVGQNTSRSNSVVGAGINPNVAGQTQIVEVRIQRTFIAVGNMGGGVTPATYPTDFLQAKLLGTSD
jgi:hypothetical protein